MFYSATAEHQFEKDENNNKTKKRPYAQSSALLSRAMKNKNGKALIIS